MPLLIRYIALESISRRSVKRIGLYAIIRKCGYGNNLMLVVPINPTISFAKQFLFIKKHIVPEKII